MRKRYLFIRILEACNAKCFMCGFAASNDRYRFSLAEFDDLLDQAQALGVEHIRLTGGEPLLHKQIIDLVRTGARAGMKMSIITNGQLLPRMIAPLADADLAQIIVSLDGAAAATHDSYRNTAGLFEACLSGLKRARELGVLTRVNTVVGPHNYSDMPNLQDLLTVSEVRQWELSALKLEEQVTYPNPDHVVATCEPLYAADPTTALIPMGKRFYGETEDKRTRFFHNGILPRPSPPHCHLIGDVLYLDAKAGRGFGCSLLPHRDTVISGGGVPMLANNRWHLNAEGFDSHVATFRDSGPTTCRHCSTTAAGYSDDVARAITPGFWHF